MLQATLATISTEAEIIAEVSGAKAAKYTFSILEYLGISRQVPTILLYENTARIIMSKSKKPTYRARNIDVQHFSLQEWVEIKQVILEKPNPPKFS